MYAATGTERSLITRVNLAEIDMSPERVIRLLGRQSHLNGGSPNMRKFVKLVRSGKVAGGAAIW